MELTSEKSCCSAGNNQVDEQAGITQHRWQLSGDKYEQHGYLLPRLIFWNICSRSMTVPLRENELGVALVSGFSPAVMQMVLSGELDPYKCLLEQLNKERCILLNSYLGFMIWRMLRMC